MVSIGPPRPDGVTTKSTMAPQANVNIRGRTSSQRWLTQDLSTCTDRTADSQIVAIDGTNAVIPPARRLYNGATSWRRGWQPGRWQRQGEPLMKGRRRRRRSSTTAASLLYEAIEIPAAAVISAFPWSRICHEGGLLRILTKGASGEEGLEVRGSHLWQYIESE